MANEQHPFGIWTEPDEQVMLNLYNKAREFQKKTPWLRMQNNDNFVVIDPVSGINGYCCVYGQDELLHGFQVFLGDEAFRSLMDNLEDIHFNTEDSEGNMSDDPLLAHQDLGMTLHCLNLSFGEKNDLNEYELDFLKDNKLKFSSEKWPLFRIMIPGFVPWAFKEEHARFMICCLEQVMAVLEEAKQDPELEFNDFYEQGCMVLTRIPLPASSPMIWQTKYRKAKAFTQDFDLMYRFKPSQLNPLTAKPVLKGSYIDFANIILPIIVQDTIPYRFARCLICIDSKKSTPWFSDILPYQADHNQLAMNKLLVFLNGLDKKPEKIRISGIPRSESLIEAMNQARIHVDWVDNLPKCHKIAKKLLDKIEIQENAPSPNDSAKTRKKPKLKIVN